MTEPEPLIYQRSPSLQRPSWSEIVQGFTRNIIVRVFYLQAEGTELFRDFLVRKSILKSASPRIANILGQPSDPEVLCLEVRGLTPNVVELILQFLHSYSLPVKGLKLEIFAGIYMAAQPQRLDIPFLSQFCRGVFQAVNMKCDTVLSHFKTLTLGDDGTGHEYPLTYYCEVLKICYKYILENADKVLTADGFFELALENVEAIIRSDFFNAEELVIYRAVKKWAKCQCQKGDLPLNSENLRKVLRRPGDNESSIGILDKIRFPLMYSESEHFEEIQFELIADNILPEEIIESFSNGETSKALFSSKERLCANNSHQVVDFEANLEKHVEGFAESYFGSMSYPTIQRMEDRPHRLIDPVTPSQDLCNENDNSYSSGFISNGSGQRNNRGSMAGDAMQIDNIPQVKASAPDNIDTRRGDPSLSNRLREFVSGIDVEENVDAVNRCLKKIQPLKEFLKHFDSLTVPDNSDRGDFPSGFIKDCIEKCLANVDEEKAQEWENDLRLFVSNYLFPCHSHNIEANTQTSVCLTSDDEVDEANMESNSCSENAEFDASSSIPTSIPKESESEIIPESAGDSEMIPDNDIISENEDDPNTSTIGLSTREDEDTHSLSESAFCRSQEITLLDHTTATPSCTFALSRFEPQFASSPFRTIPLGSKSKSSAYCDGPSSTTANKKVPSTPTCDEHEHDEHAEDLKIEIKNDDFIKETPLGRRKTNLKMRYSDIIEKCIKKPNVTKVDLSDMVMDDFTKNLSSSFPSVSLPNLKKFQVQATLTQIGEPKCKLPLENFIFFYGKNKKSEERLSELWSNCVRTKIVLNGVTIFSAAPITGKLTLTHPKDSTFVQLKSQEMSGLSSLTIVNCALKRKCWLEQESSDRLKSLRLYFYTTDRSMKPIIDPLKLNTFLTLKHIVLWPNENQTPVFSLNHLPVGLETLAVSSHLIKYEESDIAEVLFPNVTKITFKDCTWDPEFVYEIPDLFPKLRFVFVTSRFIPPSPDLLEALLKIDTVEEAFIGNLDLNLLRDERFLEIRRQLPTVGKHSNEYHLRLTREAVPNSPWKGANISRKSDFARLIYDAFSFDTIYTFQSWKEFVWEKDAF